VFTSTGHSTASWRSTLRQPTFCHYILLVPVTSLFSVFSSVFIMKSNLSLVQKNFTNCSHRWAFFSAAQDMLSCACFASYNLTRISLNTRIARCIQIKTMLFVRQWTSKCQTFEYQNHTTSSHQMAMYILLLVRFLNEWLAYTVKKIILYKMVDIWTSYRIYSISAAILF
jgi:hypothetical protein